MHCACACTSQHTHLSTMLPLPIATQLDSFSHCCHFPFPRTPLLHYLIAVVTLLT
jgi:hypothetical protein